MYDSARVVKVGSWSAKFAERPDSFFCFFRKSGEILSVSGVSADSKKEDFRLLHSFKHHRFENFPGGLIETRSSAESSLIVSRACEYSGNSLRTTLDLILPKNLSSRQLSVEGVEFLANCVSLTVLSADFNGEYPFFFEKHDIRGKTVNFSWDYSPLVFLLETESGDLIEVGTGDDIWRWNVAKSLSLKSSFCLSVENGRPKIVRNLLCSEEPFQAFGRNFRMTWYLAWKESASIADHLHGNGNSSIFDLKKDFKWPESSLAMSEDGGHSTAPCFHSDFVWNVLKKMLRHELETGVSEIIVKGARPVPCFSASHLDRAKKKLLPHWNMMAMMKFWLWANKQSHPRGASFRFVPDNAEDILFSLPSLAGISEYHNE